VAGNIQIAESTNLTDWTSVGNALPGLPAWATPDATWAPAVALIGGEYVLYYAAEVAGPGGGEECISVATATRPQGPFVDDSSSPLECQPSLGGSLDPSPFVDTDGNVYLVWKSNGGGGPATIWSEQLDPAGTAFAAGATPSPLLQPSQAWEAGVVEAPDLVTSGGRYFLFYSGNSWSGGSYAVGVATCAGPLGPCTKPLSQPVLASSSTMEGPGGESVFTDSSGSYWMAFAAWVPGAVGYPHSRDLFVRRLDLSGATPALEPAG
jgi:beta-xylosidase